MLLLLYHLQLKNYYSSFKDLSLAREQDAAKESTPIFKVSLMLFLCRRYIQNGMFHLSSSVGFTTSFTQTQMSAVGFCVLTGSVNHLSTRLSSLKTYFRCEKYCLPYVMKGIKDLHHSLSKVSQVSEPQLSQAPRKSLNYNRLITFLQYGDCHQTLECLL